MARNEIIEIFFIKWIGIIIFMIDEKHISFVYLRFGLETSRGKTFQPGGNKIYIDLIYVDGHI